MAGNVDNLILEQLRPIRSDVDRIRSDVESIRRDMDEGFQSVGARVDGVALLMTLLASHVHGLEERVERLETNR